MQRTSAPNIGEAPLPQRARKLWKTRISAHLEGLEKLLEIERAQLPLWGVVGFGSGIAAWFTLAAASAWLAFLCLTAALTLLGLGSARGRAGRSVGWFALAAMLGCALVWARSALVAEPRLEHPMVTTFEASVERLEILAARESVRLTLAPADPALPPRVRVNLPQEQTVDGLAAGSRLRLRARLMPPPPMALPGSHDFARDFWFRGIGATGRALGPVEVLQSAEPRGLDGLRARLDRHIRNRLPGSAGTVATAFATGDQNAISDEDAEAMRRSGLAHLLSVGGLHITAAVGLAMFLALRILALSETLALRLNLVMVAAAAGALAGIGYTLLTGSQVPMVRSCIAALVVLCGIALGREAISFRMLAVAAVLILTFQPEALVGPSFQLSFAAVGAIIALHSTGWARRQFMPRDEHYFARLCRALANLLATGLAVESAVMPFALFHFHKAGMYGVLANLIAIPLTSLVILPLEAASLLLDAAGLGAPLWWLTGQSLDLLLGLAHSVAAVTRMATTAEMPSWAFGMMVFGGLWLGLWTTRVRLLGLAGVAAGAIGAALAPVPDLLVTGDGRHLAVVQDGTPLILRDRAGDYVRSLLAEAAGFEGDPELLEGTPTSDCSRDACVATLRKGRTRWRLLATRSAQRIDWRRITSACASADIVVSDRRLPRGCQPRWLKLDRSALERTGGISIRLVPKPRVETVAERVGGHPWAADQ